MTPIPDFPGSAPERVYAAILVALGVTASTLVFIALGARRRPRDPDPPRKLSALAGLSFWLALAAFGMMSAGFLLLTVTKHADVFHLRVGDLDELVMGATVLSVAAAVPAGLSALLALAAIASVRGDASRRTYGAVLALLSLLICAVVLVGTYRPRESLSGLSDAYYPLVKDR